MLRHLLLIYLLFFSFSLQAATLTAPPPFAAFGFENYQTKSFFSASNGTFKFTKDKQTKTIKWHGRKWDLRFTKYPDNQARDAAIAGIIEQVKANGGQTLHHGKDTYYGKVSGELETVYIELVTSRNKEIRLYLYQQNHLLPNQPSIVSYKQGEPKEQLLTANFDGEHYYILKAEILSGDGFDLTVKNDLEDANPRIRTKEKFEINKKYYQQYALYNLDPYKGVHTFHLTPVSRKTKETQVKFTLEKTPYKVTPLGELSPKAGLFTLKNSLSSLPKLEPLGHVNGKYKVQGDFLPNGDAIYWLNNAYYHSDKDGFKTHLIPIRANHKTTVEWPLYFEEMKAAQAQTDSSQATTKMAIYEVHDKGNNTVAVDLSLSHLPRGVTLAKEDFSALEGGTVAGEVTQVESLHEPMNVAILLDSSGSMKKDMKLALKAVESFIHKLPEDANITLVDFDTTVKPIKAKSRKDIIAKLRKIKPNGATALYDSVIKARELLDGKSRASVVLFTDGKDANHNDTKRGSKATFDEMIQNVQASHIPIYPIAFGNNADVTSLQTIAQMTKTTYYQGDTEEKLNAIFDDIAHSLSSAFRVTFKRGKAAATGSQPVVNYMVDVSGSMDIRHTMRKTCEGCSYRFEPLKAMLADSARALPDNTFIQLNTFSNQFRTHQILTQDKAKILAGIGDIEIGGGTDIVGAIKQSLALSQIIPSNRRYLIFATDAAGDAFKFKEEQEKELKASLLALKKAGIQSFWIGMWDSEATQAQMNRLAKLSGGEAFVSSDIQQIRDKILAVTQRINDNKAVASDFNTLSLKLKKRNEQTGELIVAVGQKETSLSPPEVAPQDEVSDIAYRIEPFQVDKQSYNANYAQSIYGDDMPLKDVRLLKSLPLVDDQQQAITGKNEAIQLSIDKAHIFSRLKGINAGSKSQYLVLDLAMKNILPEQDVVVVDDGSKHPSGWLNKSNRDSKTVKAIPTYQIPNLKNHLFIRVNNTHELPFNPITWALAKPLTEIDQFKVSIAGESHLAGVLAFKIPDQPIKSLSLHYYDSAYGHIDLPVIGEMQLSKKEVETLPQQAPVKLSDAFALTVKGQRLETELMGTTAPKDSVFKVLDLQLQSQVNALLKLEPYKRFHLQIQTEQGDWSLSPHALSSRIPFGLDDKLSLAPASHNALSLVFQIPKGLEDKPQQLIAELKGEDKTIALSEDTPSKTSHKPLATGQAEGIRLAINSLYKPKRIDGKNRQRLLVDITLEDAQDLEATNLRNFLFLANTPNPNLKGRASAMGENAASSKGLGGFASSNKETKDSKNFVGLHSDTQSRVLGCHKVILDGTKQRCTVLFSLDKIKHKGTLYLVSGIFEDLKYEFNPKKLEALPQEQSYRIARSLELKSNDNLDALKELLTKVRLQKREQAKSQLAQQKLYSLEDGTEVAQAIDPMPISFYGAQQRAAITTEQQAIEALKALQWVPNAQDRQLFSSDTMFTQGWGTQYEMAAFLQRLLKQKNIPVTLGYYPLTKAGKEELSQRAKGVPLPRKFSHAYFLEWEEDNQQRNIVFPFLEDQASVSAWIDTTGRVDNASLPSLHANISIELHYEKDKSSAAMQMGGLGSSLSGGSQKAKRTEIFSRSYALNTISNMPQDVWFSWGKDRHGKDVLNTHITTPNGVYTKDTSLSSKLVPQKLVIRLNNGTSQVDPYTFTFKEGQKLPDLFFTFSFASPNLSKAALTAMDEEKKLRFKNVKLMSDFSQLQWINRLKMYRFIGMQSQYEQHLQDTLKVQSKRNKNPRTLMALIEKTSNSKLISSLDLRYAHADVYGDEKAVHSFNLMNGLFAARAEASVVDNGQGVFERWQAAKIAEAVMIYPSSKQAALDTMAQNGTSEAIIQRLKQSKKVWFYPLHITENPAWLEIDPQTYQTVSVLANGMYGSASEYSPMQTLITDGSQYLVGYLAGTEIAMGSVVVATFLYNDYDQIISFAENMANVIGCGVSMVSSVKGLNFKNEATALSSAADIPLAAAGCKDGDAARKVGIGKGFAMTLSGVKDLQGDAIKGVLGFGNGFGDAIGDYFKQAKKAK